MLIASIDLASFPSGFNSKLKSIRQSRIASPIAIFKANARWTLKPGSRALFDLYTLIKVSTIKTK